MLRVGKDKPKTGPQELPPQPTAKASPKQVGKIVPKGLGPEIMAALEPKAQAPVPGVMAAAAPPQPGDPNVPDDTGAPAQAMSFKKVPQPIALYRGPDQGPFQCSNCDYYNDDKSCTIVDGEIDPEGICNVFTPISASADDQGEPDEGTTPEEASPDEGSEAPPTPTGPPPAGPPLQ